MERAPRAPILFFHQLELPIPILTTTGKEISVFFWVRFVLSLHIDKDKSCTSYECYSIPKKNKTTVKLVAMRMRHLLIHLNMVNNVTCTEFNEICQHINTAQTHINTAQTCILYVISHDALNECFLCQKSKKQIEKETEHKRQWNSITMYMCHPLIHL